MKLMFQAHTFSSRGIDFVNKMPQTDKEQRQLLIAPLEAAEHLHISPGFEKPPEKKITRADWQATGPPYTPARDVEIDIVITNRGAQNIIDSVESNTSTVFPRDHFPLEIRMKNKTGQRKKRRIRRTARHGNVHRKQMQNKQKHTTKK